MSWHIPGKGKYIFTKETAIHPGGLRPVIVSNTAVRSNGPTVTDEVLAHNARPKTKNIYIVSIHMNKDHKITCILAFLG